LIWPDALATLIGAVVAFAFGAAWYGALARPWMRAARQTPGTTAMSAVLLLGSFVLLVIVSGGVGWLLATVGIERSVPSAVIVTAIAWLTLLAAPMAVNHRYQRVGWGLTVIDALHWLVVFQIAALTHVLMGGAPKLGVL
jgi:hypothetical protein